MEAIIKGIFIVFSIVAWVVGGQGLRQLRTIGIPVALTICLGLILTGDWMHRIIFALLSGACANTICIGYGNYEDGEENSFIAEFLAWFGFKDYSGEYIRGIWGLIVSSLTALPLALGGYLPWMLYCLYVAYNVAVNFLVSKLKLPVFLTDILVAFAFSSLVFFV